MLNKVLINTFKTVLGEHEDINLKEYQLSQEKKYSLILTDFCDFHPFYVQVV